MARHLTMVASPCSPGESWGFNSRDLIALTCWMQHAEQHGYRRILIEGGSGEGGPEDGGYVLIYAPHQEWASWGVARSGYDLVVWHCGTGADQGRYVTMSAALDALPPVNAVAGGRRPGLVVALRPPAEPSMQPPRLRLVHPS